jgi:hypothetical protein
MTHVRKSIRDAVVQALDGLSTTQDRVFPGRVYPLEAAALPGLLVYMGEESIEISSLGVSRLLQREPELTIEACFKDAVSLDDKGDEILEQVEAALGPGVNLGGAKWLQLTRIEIERDGDGEKPAARLRIIFKVLYYTAHGAPANAL